MEVVINDKEVTTFTEAISVTPPGDKFPYWYILFVDDETEEVGAFYHVSQVKTLAVKGGEKEDNGTVRNN